MRRPDSLTVAHLRPLFEGSEVPIGMLLSMHSAVHLRAMYRLFPGDLEQALIFDELVAHAAGPMNESLWVLNSELYAEPDGLVTRASNVHSLAAATGIPRETVRRKVKALVAAGWVERSRAGHLTLKPPTAQHLAALAAYTDVLSSFLATARALEALLARKAALADPLPP